MTPTFWHRIFTYYVRCSDHRCKLRILNWMLKSRAFQTVTSDTRAGLMRLNTGDFLQHRILVDGAYERSTCDCIESLLRPTDLFIDIGANIGQYTLLAARLVGREGVVVAIEPNPETFCDLRHNIALNDLQNVYPVLCAVSDRASLLAFSDPPAGNRGASRQANNTTDTAFFVGAFPVPEFLRATGRNPAPRLVKIDVEGNERSVLVGLLDNPQNHPDHIVFEFLPNDFSYVHGPAALLALVVEKGYCLRNVAGAPYRLGDELPDDNLWAEKIGRRDDLAFGSTAKA